MDIREVFARNLRTLRRRRGLSQEALAHDAGVDRSYISQLECSRYSASLTMIRKLARALGVAPSDLLNPTGQNDAPSST